MAEACNVKNANQSTFGLSTTNPTTGLPSLDLYRRVEVAADTTLHKLHWVVRLGMGWANSHLHQFIIGNLRYSQPEFDEGDLGTLDEFAVRLRDVVWEPRGVFVYEYDLGDSWEHDLLVEGIYPRQSGERYPRCIPRADERFHRLRRLPIEVLPVREALALNAAEIKAAHPISYADACGVTATTDYLRSLRRPKRLPKTVKVALPRAA